MTAVGSNRRSVSHTVIPRGAPVVWQLLEPQVAAGEPLLGTGSQSDVASPCSLSPVIQLEPSHPVPQSAVFVHPTDVFRIPPSATLWGHSSKGASRERAASWG